MPTQSQFGTAMTFGCLQIDTCSFTSDGGASAEPWGPVTTLQLPAAPPAAGPAPVGHQSAAATADDDRHAPAPTAPDASPEVDVANETLPPARALEKATVPQLPAWEVDRLEWPSLCDELAHRESEFFGHAGHKLAEASRCGLNLLAVTATAPREGCTTVALCLARAAAAAGARVALLDANLHQPRLAVELGLNLEHDWRSALRHEVSWAEAAVGSLHDGVAVLPIRDRGLEGQASLASGIPDLLRRIAQHFDLVVLDLGPLTSEARYVLGSGRHCVADAAMLVRDLRTTDEETALITATRLRSLGVQAVGICENFLPRAAARSAA